MSRTFQILGLGKYLPERVVTSEEIDRLHGYEAGTAENKSGVKSRHFASGEKVSDMGARACARALEAAGLTFTDMDALIYVGATREQALPCNAIFIQRAMGEGKSGVACFDIDATCLSFLIGLDQITLAIAGGRYKRVLLVSSEIASNHLNPEHVESASLFGDGACAWVLGTADDQSAKGPQSEILSAYLASYGDYADICGVPGGCSSKPAFEYTKESHKEYCFNMEGRRLFKISAQVLPGAVEKTLAPHGLSIQDIHWVIPHQASESALALMRKRLGVPEERWITIIENHGNQISASLPTAFYELQQSGKLKKGELVLFLGTGAGFGVGTVLLRY